MAWTVWFWGEARWFQATRESRLAEITAEGVEAPAPGTALAQLSVPRLGLAVVVAEGTSEQVLRRAVGRLSTGALPGEEGNLVLAGHRDTFFRPLREIEVGDRVTVERGAATDVYVVEWTRVVSPQTIEVAADAGYPALTLVTCYPFNYIGRAPERFVVRARLTGQRG